MKHPLRMSFRTATYLIVICTFLIFWVLLKTVKYCALISEVIGNVGIPNNACNSYELRIVLATVTFVFGLLEGGMSCWKTMRGDDEESPVQEA